MPSAGMVMPLLAANAMPRGSLPLAAIALRLRRGLRGGRQLTDAPPPEAAGPRQKSPRQAIAWAS